MGFKENLREDVFKAVKKSKKSGIKVIMITGDSKWTAQNVAQKCGILDNEIQPGSILECKDFMNRFHIIILKLSLIKHFLFYF